MRLIKREEVPTETGRKLYDLLVASWDDPEFVYCTLVGLRGDAKKQKLIDVIKERNLTDSDDIINASLDIEDED